MSTTKEVTFSKGLHVLDPDLSLLASEAAIDIENILSNRSNELTAVKDLADRLMNSIEINNAGLHHALMDPATLTVLGDAVARATGNNKYAEKIDSLLDKAVNIGEDLHNIDPVNNPEGLKKARDFCLGLAMAVAAYRQSIRDLRPMHSLRR